MNLDLLAIIKRKLDLHSFCINYFEMVKQSSSFNSDHNKEKINLSLASALYKDYVYSDLNFDDYYMQMSGPTMKFSGKLNKAMATHL